MSQREVMSMVQKVTLIGQTPKQKIKSPRERLLQRKKLLTHKIQVQSHNSILTSGLPSFVGKRRSQPLFIEDTATDDEIETFLTPVKKHKGAITSARIFKWLIFIQFPV